MNQKYGCWKHFQQTRSENSYASPQHVVGQEFVDDASFHHDNEDEDTNLVQSVNSDNKEENSEIFPPHSQKVSLEGLKAMLGEGTTSTLPPRDEFRLSLYAMLSHPSIPLYIFPSVMRLLNSAITSPDSQMIFSKTYSVCRITTKKEVEKCFPVPKAKSVPFRMETKDDGEKESSLVIFDVKKTIIQEAQHPDLWHRDNLASKGDRWFQHQPPHSDEKGMVDFSNTISGRAFARAYKKYIVDPDKELLVPFVAWIDESGVTGNLRHPVQPLLVKCLLLKKELQRFCPLAYIPCTTKSSAENKQDSSSEASRGINTRNFHAALSTVFREWDEAANWFAKNPQQVTLGRSTAKMVLKPVILCFLGDHKSQLMLSCLYSNSVCSECQSANPWLADDHREKLKKDVDTREIRKCNLEMEELESKREELKKRIDDANGGSQQRNLLKRQLATVAMKHTQARKKLKRYHVIPCKNAFSTFQHIARPINHCSPADHLHVFLLGVLKTSALCTIGNFTDKQKKGLDDLARQLFESNSSSARCLFPRFYIEKGMTNTGNLTGSEWVGFFFALLVVGLTENGKRLITSSLENHYQKTKDLAKAKIKILKKSISECKPESRDGPNNMMNQSKVDYLNKVVTQPNNASYSQFIDCIEQMLVFHAFVNQKRLLWSASVGKSFDKKLRIMMQQIVFCFPRVEGDCHKYPKDASIETSY